MSYSVTVHYMDRAPILQGLSVVNSDLGSSSLVYGHHKPSRHWSLQSPMTNTGWSTLISTSMLSQHSQRWRLWMVCIQQVGSAKITLTHILYNVIYVEQYIYSWCDNVCVHNLWTLTCTKNMRLSHVPIYRQHAEKWGVGVLPNQPAASTFDSVGSALRLRSEYSTLCLSWVTEETSTCLTDDGPRSAYTRELLPRSELMTDGPWSIGAPSM